MTRSTKSFTSALSRLPNYAFGIELLPDATRRSELNDWLTHKVRPRFEQRVLAISEDLMFRWRLLVQEGRKVGYTFSQPDLIIAATAQHHGLTVVSRDTTDYATARIEVFNPWVDLPPRTLANAGASPALQSDAHRQKCNEHEADT